jgi:N-hydroxyarylamine O-acetyltransferase
LQNIPFENLDITLGRRIHLQLPTILDKIINQRRGGFCYELNSGFAWLLRQIGFKVDVLSARTYDGNKLSPDFDHMLLRVATEQPVIADVGFGDSFLLPIALASTDCFQFDRQYRLTNNKNRWVLQQKYEAGEWISQYVFDFNSHPLSHFEAMCHHHQTSQVSIFTRKTVCSRATAKGRITYANGRYIVNDCGQRTEKIIDNEAGLNRILKNHFGIRFPASDLSQLMSRHHNHYPEVR